MSGVMVTSQRLVDPVTVDPTAALTITTVPGIGLSKAEADALYAPIGAGGAVESVNGHTGVVVLGASDVSAQPVEPDLTTIAALDSSTAGALVTDGSGWIRKTYAQLKTALSLVKADVGLGSVDNTSDAAKPVSTAQQTALDLKANLASPTFTGTPAAPTPTAADSTTKLATTAFVQGEITAKAPLASPTFTGDPKAPTASPGDNDTSIATTAFVAAAVAAGGGGGGSSAAFRNRIINGNFRTNQRGYASGTSTASGSYGFDRWKSGAAGSTMTFTAAPQGQLVTINSGGVWNQVIERANLEAGTFTISWAGTATCRAYKVGDTPPSYAASPITVTPDGTGDYVVEFTASGATKTLGSVQIEAGSSATAYEQVPLQDELLRCQRYYQRWNADATATALNFFDGAAYNGSSVYFVVRLNVTMRAVPTVAFTALKVTNNIATNTNVSALNVGSTQSTTSIVLLTAAVGASTVTNNAYYMLAATGSTAFIAFDAEL